MRNSAEIQAAAKARRILDNAACYCRTLETLAGLLETCDPRWRGGVVERETLANLGILIFTETKKLSDLMKELRMLLAKRSAKKP